MRNILIVEGKTDKKFLENYIDYLQKTFSKRIFLIDDIKNAEGQNALPRSLKALKIDITRGDIKNIGILIDADDVGIKTKINTVINPAIKEAFNSDRQM